MLHCILLPFSFGLFIRLFLLCRFTFRQLFLSFFQFLLPLFSSHSLHSLSSCLFLFCSAADCISFSFLSLPLLIYFCSEHQQTEISSIFPRPLHPGASRGSFYSSCAAFSRLIVCEGSFHVLIVFWSLGFHGDGRDGKSAVRTGSNLKWVSLPRWTLRPGETAQWPTMNSSVSCGDCQLFNMSLKHIHFFMGRVWSVTQNIFRTGWSEQQLSVCLFSI